MRVSLYDPQERPRENEIFLDHVLQILSVSKHRYSFELLKSIWFLSVVPSYVRCIFPSVVNKPLIDGKYFMGRTKYTFFYYGESEQSLKFANKP